MTTIFTKYLGATNFRGSRVKAWVDDEHKRNVTIDWKDELSSEENHDAAAIAFVKKHMKNAPNTMIRGGNGYINTYTLFNEKFIESSIVRIPE